ncbi:uncharacterized protein LOC135368250 [Ornithodoros turicata]|uniref:uncharacterized protein LOC135368250 n=1 Tax=Ornithodoros turicata TaxID=34597 RepID=UPI003138D29A
MMSHQAAVIMIMSSFCHGAMVSGCTSSPGMPKVLGLIERAREVMNRTFRNDAHLGTIYFTRNFTSNVTDKGKPYTVAFYSNVLQGLNFLVPVQVEYQRNKTRHVVLTLYTDELALHSAVVLEGSVSNSTPIRILAYGTLSLTFSFDVEKNRRTATNIRLHQLNITYNRTSDNRRTSRDKEERLDLRSAPFKEAVRRVFEQQLLRDEIYETLKEKISKVDFNAP